MLARTICSFRSEGRIAPTCVSPSSLMAGIEMAAVGASEVKVTREVSVAFFALAGAIDGAFGGGTIDTIGIGAISGAGVLTSGFARRGPGI